jgi:hypothetical protein
MFRYHSTLADVTGVVCLEKVYLATGALTADTVKAACLPAARAAADAVGAHNAFWSGTKVKVCVAVFGLLLFIAVIIFFRKSGKTARRRSIKSSGMLETPLF